MIADLVSSVFLVLAILAAAYWAVVASDEKERDR